MKAIVLSIAASALLLGSPVLSAQPAKPKGHLGSEWVNAKGNSRAAQMGLQIQSERGVTPDIYRPVRLEWPAGDLQKGKYPGDITKD
jgi:hypothetical protein